MSLPDYIRTEWKTRGCAHLRFCSFDCKNCVEVLNQYGPKRFINITSETLECVHSKGVQYYMSTLNVWEYKDDLNISEDFENVGDDQKLHLDVDSISSADQVEETKPLSIDKETWDKWLKHWKLWKDDYINLSWVKRFKDHCSKQNIDWYDNYYIEYPEVISYISYCEDIELVSETLWSRILNTSVDEEGDDGEFTKDQVLCMVYDEFVRKRYWIHFRLFMRDLNIEINEEHKEFFASHRIENDPPKMDYESDDYDKHELMNSESDGFDKLNNESDGFDKLNNESDGFDKRNSESNGFDKLNSESDGFDKPNSESDGFDKLNNESVGFDKRSSESDGFDKQNESDGFDKRNSESDGFVKRNSDSDCTNDTKNNQISENMLKGDNETIKEKNVNEERELPNQQDFLHLQSTNNTKYNESTEAFNENENSTKLLEGNIQQNFTEEDDPKKMNGFAIDTENPNDEETILNTMYTNTNVNVENTDVTEEICINKDESSKTIIESNELVQENKRDLKNSATKKNQKKSRKQNAGVAWALKHLQTLGDEARSSSPESKPFVFGANSESPQQDYSPNTVPIVTLSNPRKERTSSKRKHDVLEDSGEHNKRSSSLITGQNDVNETQSYRLVSSKTVLDGLSYFRSILETIWVGFSNFMMALLGGNLFAKRNSWNTSSFTFHFKWWDKLTEDKKRQYDMDMLNLGKRSKNKFTTIFNYSVREWTKSSDICEESLHMTKVLRQNDDRMLRENLVQVSHTESFESGVDVKDIKSLYVGYLTEEDVDFILEEMADFPKVNQESSPPHRTLTFFDDEGMPKDVIKVPTSNGKMKCVLQDDYNGELDSVNETPQGIKVVDEWPYCSEVQFDSDGNPVLAQPKGISRPKSPVSWHDKITKVLSHSHLMRFTKDEVYSVPNEIEAETAKYWCQRYRLFLRYDEGIKLDYESWYSVTPEMISAHQAERLACDVVIDAFCGAGGNAIQLAATCNRVVAIDIDPAKIEMARHNARIYGVENRIDFIHGDFFQIASTLHADCILLSPPWGGIDYQKKEIYDIYSLDGQMKGKTLFQTALSITSNIALYLPRNSNLFQIIELAQYMPSNPRVDVESSHISNKRKSLTAYYGDLVNFGVDE